MVLNDKIFYALNSLAGHSALADSTIIFFAVSLPWVMVAFAIIYLIFFHRNLLWFSVAMVTSLLSLLITDILKWVIFRHPRPFVALTDVIQLIYITPYDSFPSGHATVFGALATVMFLYNKRIGVWFIAGAVLVGLARISSGIHYPLDILTGYLIGFTVTFFSYRLWRGLSSRITDFIS